MLRASHRPLARKSFLLAVLAAAVCGVYAAGPAAADANLIINGSFENPTLNVNQWVLYTPGTIPAGFGWKLLSGQSIELQHVNAAGQPAADGNQFVELDSNGSSAIYQDVATVAGQQYELSWYFSGRQGTAATENKLGVYVNTPLVATCTKAGEKSGTNFSRYSYVFSATDDTTRIAFADLGTPSDSLGTYLDNVRLVAIPEPAFLQFGALLGLSAFGLRRRRA